MTAKNAEVLAVKEGRVTDSSKQLDVRASRSCRKASTLGRLWSGRVASSGVVRRPPWDKLLSFINGENERLYGPYQHKSGVDQQFCLMNTLVANGRGTGVALRRDMFLPRVMTLSGRSRKLSLSPALIGGDGDFGRHDSRDI